MCRSRIEAGDSPARVVVPSLSYRYVAYLFKDSDRVRDSCLLVKITSEAGAAAYGTNVRGPLGCPNRTFVLLFPKCHLGGAFSRKALRWLGERIGDDRDIVHSMTFTCRGWAGSTKSSIQPVIKQEPCRLPKVASPLFFAPARPCHLSHCGQFSSPESGSRARPDAGSCDILQI